MTGPMVPEPAYRRFLTDMTRQDYPVLPPALLHHPELAALEEVRQRLLVALDDAGRSSGPRGMTDEAYVAVRAKALRDGGDMPSPPPTQASRDAYNERKARDVLAAETALLALADDICDTVRAHPGFEDEAKAYVGERKDHAAEMRRAADEADREAERAWGLALWLNHVSRDELYCHVPAVQAT